MAAENYHLKWDSHLSYLNTSVATLYKNEKFADVVLYSSSSICGAGSTADGGGGGGGIPTVGISAHKFILSSCSQFFATMFETAPLTAPNGVLYVVLPPDLSHRAIQILVQYMYSGEATVSNDILNEVLRGGEILKIRGLCRSFAAHQHHHLFQQRERERERERDAVGGYSAPSSSRPPPNLPLPPPPVSHEPLYGISKCSSKMRHYGIEPSQLSTATQPFRGLGASVMPKDSPVIVKSPKLAQMGLLPSSGAGISSSSGGSNSKHIPSTGAGVGASGGGGGGISINKEMAIDPAEEKCCYQLPLNAHEQPPALCREPGCTLTTTETEHPARSQRRVRRRSDEFVGLPHLQLSLNREYIDQPSVLSEEQSRGGHVHHRDLAGRDYDSRRMRRNSGGGDFYASTMHEQYEPSTPTHPHAKQPLSQQQQHQPQQFVASAAVSALRTSPPPLVLQRFLQIKQEPGDWTSSTAQPLSAISPTGGRELHLATESPKQPLEYKMMVPSAGAATVKIEAASSAHSADDDEELHHHHPLGDEDYQCHDSVAKSSSWLQRRLEAAASHSTEVSSLMSDSGSNTLHGSNAPSSAANSADVVVLAKSYVPKKRRRVSQQQENNMNHVTLLCDLCKTSFETPAEWVRHMNSQHTDIELAIFNSKKDVEHKHMDQQQQQQQQQQRRQQLSHKKYGTRSQPIGFATEHTHSPRTCDICNKRFSSHNNMLLHRRSSHLLQHNGSSVGGIGADTDEDDINNASIVVSDSPVSTASLLAGGIAEPHSEEPRRIDIAAAVR